MAIVDRPAQLARGTRSLLLRGAGAALVASGVLGVAMVATLLAMFVGFGLGPDLRQTALRIGWLNDALAIVVYALALPAVAAVHVLVRETGEARSVLIAVVGAAGLAAAIYLQWLLVTGALTFEQQIGPVAIALLTAGAWMVATGWLAQRAGLLPRGLRNGLLGAFYLGYPIWAIDLGRRLLRGGGPS